MRFLSLDGLPELVLGTSAVIIPLVAYSIYVNSIPVLDAPTAHQLEFLAYSVFALTLVGISSAVIGLRELVRASRKADYNAQHVLRALARMFEQKRYGRMMLVVSLMYGAVFAFLSGMIVYSPLESFGSEYSVRIPSAVVAVCCGTAGFIPVMTVFLTDHLGLLLIPTDVVLVVLVSGLVGLNVTLILGQYDNRPRSNSGRWLLGVGAACGLFTACPTCAGLLLSTVILGLGSTALVVLSGMQLDLVLGTVLALIAGTVLNAEMVAPSRTPSSASIS